MSQEHTCFQVYFRGPSWLKHRQQWLVMGSGFHENSNIHIRHIRYDMMWYDHTIFIVIFIIIPVILIYHCCYHCYHYSILKSLSANMILYHIYQLCTCSLFATTGHVSNAAGLCFFNRKIGPPSLRKCYHQGPHFVRNVYLPFPETNNAAYPWKLVAKGDKPFFWGLYKPIFRGRLLSLGKVSGQIFL